MDSAMEIFRRKSANFAKLSNFGFSRNQNQYIYKAIMPSCGFSLTVTISLNGEINTQVVDPASNDEYILHLTNGAVGSFVGNVKSDYEQILTAIAEQCFEPDIFQTEQAKKLIDYVGFTYGDELEYLWRKFPDNAIWRRRDTQKWYGAILTVSKRKLGIDSDEKVEIIDLRAIPATLETLIDHKHYFPGWHMNKKNWYTIVLDGSVSLEELCQRIDQSYLLATK